MACPSVVGRPSAGTIATETDELVASCGRLFPVHDEHMPRHWHDALAVLAVSELDCDYLTRRARQYGARRVLSLLLYAQSNDLIVPSTPVRNLFEAIFAD